MDTVDRAWVEDLVRRNRFLVLATASSEGRPWATPLEYVVGDDLDIYYFSTADARHSRDIAENPQAAVTIYDADQPKYSGELSFTLAGIQVEATVERLEEPDYTKIVKDTVATWRMEMPPYVCYAVRADRFYLPVIDEGINVRLPIDME